MSRTIRRTHRAIRDDIGDLHTWRPLPNNVLDQLDPFLFLNHHGPQVYPPGNRGLPFGPHPHRGFETVTFIVEGSLTHRDTGGHESVIEAGGVQWMTAGSGLEHAEVSPEKFLREGGPLEILQLWVNLPARLKMTEPRYVGLQKNEIPALESASGVVVNLISGGWDKRGAAEGEGGWKPPLDGTATGPIPSLTGVFMSTIEFAGSGSIALPAPKHRTIFLYVVRGGVRVGDREAGAFHLLEMNDDGDEIVIAAAAAGTILLFGHADPIREPVVSYGPFVMNTREEIVQAIRDYENGKFAGKVRI
jgi:redox-sensitive bicupin YhaK (pirin superfamily)